MVYKLHSLAGNDEYFLFEFLESVNISQHVPIVTVAFVVADGTVVTGSAVVRTDSL